MKRLFNLRIGFPTASCIVQKLPVSKLQTGLYKANVLFLLCEHVLLHINKVCIHLGVMFLRKAKPKRNCKPHLSTKMKRTLAKPRPSESIPKLYLFYTHGGRGFDGNLFSLKDHNTPQPGYHEKKKKKNVLQSLGKHSEKHRPASSPYRPPQITVVKQMVFPRPSPCPFRSPTVSFHTVLTPSPSAWQPRPHSGIPGSANFETFFLPHRPRFTFIQLQNSLGTLSFCCYPFPAPPSLKYPFPYSKARHRARNFQAQVVETLRLTTEGHSPCPLPFSISPPRP